MKMVFKAFAKKLFGAKYERLTRTVFMDVIVFWGLYIADFKLQIAPSVLYLMATAFTAGVMWQALSSEDNAIHMQNMMMLPFERREFVFSYVAAMGTYTFLTKTAALLAVLLAVSAWGWTEIVGGILCAVNAILTTAVVFNAHAGAGKDVKYWYAGAFWIAAVLAAIMFLWDSPWFLPVMAVSSALALILLYHADAYSFYIQNNFQGNFQDNKSRRTIKGRKPYSVWAYLFRYLKSHKNYLVNTVIMWCVACALPLFFRQMDIQDIQIDILDILFVVPIGFAILSLNTPICILLSCDHALEQAVRFLPGQKKTFCIPYCFFVFLCNITADVVFLCSLHCILQIQIGGITVWMIVTAVFFALQASVFSILLEWFYPIRGWKIESDLWHHPRKYLVPVAMLLLAGAVGAMPEIVPALVVLLAVEIAALLVYCWRC